MTASPATAVKKPSPPKRRPRGALGFTVPRVRTPTVIGMEGVECGAACLGIILGYYGRYVPLEQLRVICGVSREGSRANNILKAARSFGLVARGLKADLDDLARLKPPYIVFWSFNHFMVLEGVGRKKVYLNDPGGGPYASEPAGFREAYTGVVLTMEPGPDFQRGGHRPTLWSGLSSRLRGSRLALIYLVLATLTLVLPNLLVPIFARVYIDNIAIGGQEAWLRPMLLAMAATAVVIAAATHLQQLSLQRLEMRLSVSASARFFWHILRLPMMFFAQRVGGELAARIQTNARVATLLSGDLATNLVNILLIGFYAALMFQYDRVLTLCSIAIAAINLIVLQYVRRARTDINRRLLYERQRLTGVSTSGLQNIETIKATGAEADYFATWAGRQASMVSAQQQLGVSSAFVGALPAILTSLNGVFVLGLGSIRVIDGVLTLGLLLAFSVLMSSFIAPVNGLVGLGGKLQEVQGDLALLDDVLKYPVEQKLAEMDAEGDDAAAIEKLEGHLELRGVTFGYSKLDAPLLIDFNMTLRPGQRVALVGGSGSGKSTVAKLVAGLYEPWSGEILFDGQPAARVPRSVLSASLAMVDQDICMFEGSVRENLSLWDGTLEEASVVQAAKDAAIHDVIAARVGGYESPVEEAGRNFSGGQRQRMEIARALVDNPRILILDEATSALDANTEAVIQQQLRQRGCTCLIVAHRLSTVADADEIIVLEGGRVVQRGVHEVMSRVDGPYARLIEAS